MSDPSNLQAVHLAEYQQLRAEVCLRIQLQDRILNYAVIVTGGVLAALTGWVLAGPGAVYAVFSADEANAKAVTLAIGYVVILELLLCSWIYQTYICLNIHAYLTFLGACKRGLCQEAWKRRTTHMR